MLFVLVKEVAVSVREKQRNTCMLFSSWVKGGNYLYFSVAASRASFLPLFLALDVSFQILDSSHFVQKKDKNKTKQILIQER